MSDSTEQRRLYIFLSSPGDVVQERAISRDVVDKLVANPFIRDRVLPQLVAWDDPRVRTAVPASLTPQEAIDAKLRQPAHCDIVVVILWSRLGTPLDPAIYSKPDGSPYLSGTEYEFETALAEARRTKSKPIVLVYRRTDKPLFPVDDPDLDAKREQYKRVNKFFERFQPNGVWAGSYTDYQGVDRFRELLTTDLQDTINDLLRTEPIPDSRQPATPPPLPTKSPFLGFRSFTPADAPIFFGREDETDELVEFVDKTGFVAVVGSSGSGKSSIVGAGLLPQLARNALAGSKDWWLPTYDATTKQWSRLRFTPAGTEDKNPFSALAQALSPILPVVPPDLASYLLGNPQTLRNECLKALHNEPAHVRVLLFIDQFEEIFTIRDEAVRKAFIAAIADASHADRIRIVITLRADFYERCLEYAEFGTLLRAGAFSVSVPTPAQLFRMIVDPATVVGLTFAEGLSARILLDAGSKAGSLASLAFALDELFERSKGLPTLSLEVYDSFDGVAGAVAERAEDTFEKLDDEAQNALPAVFSELVRLDSGMGVRSRASLSAIEKIKGGKQLVDALTSSRLLVQSKDEANHPIVELGHEALLESWPRLRQWLAKDTEFLLWRERYRFDASRAQKNKYKLKYLYTGLPLADALNWQRGNSTLFNQDDMTFLRRSQTWQNVLNAAAGAVIAVPVLITLIVLINSLYSESLRRAAIGEMVNLPAGAALLGQPATVVNLKKFSISTTEVSIRQYQLCMQANVCSHPAEPNTEPINVDSSDERVLDMPVSYVTAHQADTFCTWIGGRLPTVAEFAYAVHGTDNRPWPWLDRHKPSPDRVNLGLADSLNNPLEPVVVTALEEGATPQNILNLYGNVSEWTRTPNSEQCEEDAYHCTQMWDGHSKVNALFVYGFGWRDSLPPQEDATGLASEGSFTDPNSSSQDTGFRCAVP